MKRCRITCTWVQDTLPPLVDCPEEVFLGCNPTSLPGLDASRIKVKDNCGIADTLYAIVDYFPDGCLYKVGYSYTFIDHCGNQTSCLEVLSWTIDNQPPTIVQCPVDVDLGCWDQDGPNDLPPPDMDAFVVDDACGEVTITYQDGFDIVINPAYCTATRVRRYIATDACGNETECWQSFTWTYDVSPPPIIQCAPDLDLGCIDDLDEVPGPYNPDDIIALDNCTNITKSWIDGEALIDGCEWEYRYRYRVEDECGNESMCIQSIQFTYIDPQAPTLEIPEDLTVFCTVPPTPDYSGVCANESLELLFEFDTGCDDNNCIVYRYWLLTTCEGKQVFGVQQISVECNITGQLAEDSGPERSDNSVKTISGYLSDSINPGKIISNYSTDPYKTATGVLKVYPNPATNVMNLTLEDVEMPHEQGQALIYDQYGRVVLQQVIGDRIENYPIRLVDLPSGMYYLEVISADK